MDAIYFVGGFVCGLGCCGFVVHGCLRWWERRAAVEVDRRTAAENAVVEWVSRCRVAEEKLGIFGEDDEEFEG